MSTKSVSFIMLALFALASLAQAQQQYLAGFLPQCSYQIMVKKSHGGNDGFKDVIPQLSVQSILVETGAVGAAGLPVTMTVNRPQRVEQASASSAPLLDWKFTFTIAGTGDVKLVDSQSSDGRLPDDIVLKILGSQLDLVLFHSAYPLASKNKTTLNILDAKPAARNTVEVAFDVTENVAPHELSAGERGTVTTITGNATYDASLKFYTRRSQTEQSKMYINDDPSGAGKIVLMQTVTTVDAVVTKKP